MYGCAEGSVVYGWNQGDEENKISCKDIESVGLSIFTTEIIRGHMCEAVYGISCYLNEETGIAGIAEENKKKVRDVFHKYISEDCSEDDVTLGFRVCISGHDESHRTLIALDRKRKM